MFKKIAALATAAVLCAGLMAGCGASSTTADTSYSAENPLVLTLAHGLSEAHTVHIAMTQFAEEVNEKTDGRIQVKIFPNGQLGSENENLEQPQAGVIAMTKVSAPGLATYNEAYNAFGLPYIFNDTEDFYHVMDSQQMQDFFLSTGDDGFVTLTYYTSGARSFYTKDRAIRTPADLKGLKIRTQDSPTSIAMIRAMGGSATPMSSGETYTGLQQGIIDGAENNETVLVQDGHGEVCKSYTYTQHQMVPDIVIISTETWESLDETEQSAIVNGMTQGNEAHEAVWQDLVQENIDGAKEMGVQFYTIDKTAFIEATQSLRDEFCAKSADNARYYEDFLSYVQA